MLPNWLLEVTWHIRNALPTTIMNTPIGQFPSRVLCIGFGIMLCGRQTVNSTFHDAALKANNPASPTPVGLVTKFPLAHYRRIVSFHFCKSLSTTQSPQSVSAWKRPRTRGASLRLTASQRWSGKTLLETFRLHTSRVMQNTTCQLSAPPYQEIREQESLLRGKQKAPAT